MSYFIAWRHFLYSCVDFEPSKFRVNTPTKFHWLSAILLIFWPVNEWKRKKNHWINEFDQNKSKHRTMIIGDKSAADTQNLPAINHLLKPMNILFPSCVKIKPWEFSDQKFQWSVSPLMRSAVSVVSLGTADDPWKKTAGDSPRPPPHGRESTWPAWLRFGPLWGKSCATKSRAERKSEESIEVGYEGDLLTRHHLNAFRLETERRYLFRGLSSVSLSFTPHQSKFIPSFSFLD